jgi:hypothetical protein
VKTHQWMVITARHYDARTFTYYSDVARVDCKLAIN